MVRKFPDDRNGEVKIEPEFLGHRELLKWRKILWQ